MRSLKSFTLVEALIAVSVLAVLSGLAVSVIDVTQKKNQAIDGVKLTKVQTLAQAVEAYKLYEQVYPTDSDANSIPDSFTNYVATWPSELDAGYIYKTDGSTFSIAILKASDITLCIKYYSAVGKIRECAASNCLAGPSACT